MLRFITLTEEIDKNHDLYFILFHRREEKQYLEGMEDAESWKAGRREMQNLAYPPAFKLEVALYAKKHSQYAAAKIFGVARRRIFDWMRQIPKLEELIAKGHMKRMTGRGPRDRDIDRALHRWYLERREAGERPKSAAVQAKAREVYAANGYTDMKCSYGWFKRWSQRFQVHKIIKRLIPVRCKSTKYDIADFNHYFQIRLRYSYDDELIEWILSRFDQNLPVTYSDLQAHGLNIVRKEDPSFKASSGWAMR